MAIDEYIFFEGIRP